MIIKYVKENSVMKFRDLGDRECFFSGGTLYMKIFSQDLKEYGINSVNAISIINSGLTKFEDDENVVKAIRTIQNSKNGTTESVDNFLKALQESKEYLSNYISVEKDIIKAILRHANHYDISPNICAWYLDWEDFCSDWCDQSGYTRTQARKLLHGGIGEFQFLPGKKGIIRYVI